jgi:hypothetical protein
MGLRDNQEFWDLRASPMAFTPVQWEEHYRALTPWLLHENTEIRSCTMERLVTAVFWSEPSCVPHKERDDAKAVTRLIWLLGEFEKAQARYPDTITQFLKNHCARGDSEPFRSPLRVWLHDLLANPRTSVRPDIVEGTLLLLEPNDDDWSRQAKRWMVLLDHPSDHLRACAARCLGSICDDDSVDPTEAELLAIITAKELERPGVAGPYWSSNTLYPEGDSHTLWMLDLLERRQGHAPPDMPFNDIDFFLHELCSHSPDLVQRMMAGGFDELAAMTATEAIQPVPGMEPILLELARSDNKRVAGSARWHLHHVYGHWPAANGGTHDDAQT